MILAACEAVKGKTANKIKVRDICECPGFLIINKFVSAQGQIYFLYGTAELAQNRLPDLGYTFSFNYTIYCRRNLKIKSRIFFRCGFNF